MVAHLHPPLVGLDIGIRPKVRDRSLRFVVLDDETRRARHLDSVMNERKVAGFSIEEAPEAVAVPIHTIIVSLDANR